MTVVPIRGAKDAPKAERSSMETLLLAPEIMNTWVLPPFQAALKITPKVRKVVDELLEQTGTPVIGGVLTLGILPNDKTLYLLDGQHRRWAAIQTGLKQFIADVRVRYFDSMEEMAAEYLELNTPLSRKTPDDQLRALAESSKPLQYIEKSCSFVGYRYIRANPDAPLVGMSAVLRRWRGSGTETPAITGHAGGASEMAMKLSMEEAELIVQFMQVAYSAWGRDKENERLWSGLNMTMCMWMWRKLVLDQDRSGSRRYLAMTVDMFHKCLMSVSAERKYIDWLVGRQMIERDRAPCYRHLRTTFMLRIHQETGENKRLKFPQPEWMTN
jgi:hypothetical protein